MDPGPSRYVKDADDKCGVPMCIYWSTEDIAEWICFIGFPQYRECFVQNFITGRHLTILDSSRLPLIGITDFNDIKVISARVRDLIGLDHIIKNMNVSMSDPMIAYMEMKRRTGRVTQNTSYQAFLNKYRRWYR
ncbi:Sterile alpha motif [Mactra antiquata]